MSGIQIMNYMPKSPGTATYQDILDAPSGMLAQIIHGKLDLQPNGAPDHQDTSGELATDLKSHFRKSKFKPGGWLILQEMYVQFDNQEIYRPDISGWRTQTLSSMPTQAVVETIPDWVCEVLSPSTRRIDRTKKMAVYAESGVAHYWILDPKAKSLEAFELEGEKWVLSAIASESDVVRIAPFEDVEIDLQYLWAGEETD